MTPPRLLSFALLLLLAGCAAEAEPPSQTPPPTTERRVIHTDQAPAAVGPYSQAIQVGGHLYLAGQIGRDPATGTLAEGVEAQTRQTMDNLNAVLTAAGYAMADVVQAQVFLADLDDFAVMNEIYASYFEADPPTRATVQVARLPRDARVEIMMVAMQ
ncbi:MAG: RidA family protein [Bacteroidota bacterium]